MTIAKKIIAIDIDDVIADSTEALRLLANERTGSTLTRNDYRQHGEYWGYYERVWEQHGLINKISFSEFEQEMSIDQSHVPLLPSADFAIHELSRKYHVILITSRNIEWKQATEKWLKLNVGIESIGVHFTGDRRSTSYRSKGQLCRDLGVWLMIDDNVQHCQSVLEHKIDAILFGEYGWHAYVPPELFRCKDWPAVLDYIDDRE